MSFNYSLYTVSYQSCVCRIINYLVFRTHNQIKEPFSKIITMKILNINIPTDKWFIRILSKYSLYLVILLVILVKTYFWLNSTEQKKVSIEIDSAFLRNEFIRISLYLGQYSLFNDGHKTLYSGKSDIIYISNYFDISTNNSSILPYYAVQEPNLEFFPEGEEMIFFKETPFSYHLSSNGDSIPEILTPKGWAQSVPSSLFKTNDDLNYFLSPTISINVISENTKFVSGDSFFAYDVNKASYSDSLCCDNILNDFTRIIKTQSKVYFQKDTKQVNNINKRRYYDFCDSTRSELRIQEIFLGDYFTSEKSNIFTEITFSINDIQYLNSDTLKSTITFSYEDTPLSIISITPEPDFRTINSFGYSNDNEIFKNGYDVKFSIYAEDLNKKDRNSKLNFLIASLIGVLFSVLAEIGVKHFERKDIKNHKIGNIELTKNTPSKQNSIAKTKIKKKRNRK